MYDMGSDVTADCFMMYYGGDVASYNFRFPYDHQFQKSSDGSTWTDVVVTTSDTNTGLKEYYPFT